MAARVLLTGGTAAARRLAEELVARLDGVEIIYALAGLTDTPRLPEHARIHVRQGGFGGAEGLAAWLRQEGIAAVIDATHPFARAMPQQVAAAARLSGLPHARFLPPAPLLPDRSPFSHSSLPPSHSSSPGLTRQSAEYCRARQCLPRRAMDPRVKPGDDGEGRPTPSAAFSSASCCPPAPLPPVPSPRSLPPPSRLLPSPSRPLPSSPRKRGSRAPLRTPMHSSQRAVGFRLHGNDKKNNAWLVNSLDEMARALPRGARVVVALGSRGLAALAARGDLHLHARMLLPPVFTVPPRWRLLTGQAGRPRRSLAREMAWLKATQAQWLLARHAQGSHALVLAALRLGITVVLQRCPAPPAGALVLEKPQEVLRWLRQTVLPLHR